MVDSSSRVPQMRLQDQNSDFLIRVLHRIDLFCGLMRARYKEKKVCINIRLTCVCVRACVCGGITIIDLLQGFNWTLFLQQELHH